MLAAWTRGTESLIIQSSPVYTCLSFGMVLAAFVCWLRTIRWVPIAASGVDLIFTMVAQGSTTYLYPAVSGVHVSLAVMGFGYGSTAPLWTLLAD